MMPELRRPRTGRRKPPGSIAVQNPAAYAARLALKSYSAGLIATASGSTQCLWSAS